MNSRLSREKDGLTVMTVTSVGINKKKEECFDNLIDSSQISYSVDSLSVCLNDEQQCRHSAKS